MLSEMEYLKLVKEVNRLRNEINLFNIEEVSESALDDLKHKITEFEQANPDKIVADSPNFLIAGGVLEKFEKYKHKHRMLSLNDVFDLPELQDWENRWGDSAQEANIKNNLKSDEVKYICEPKIDGLAISLHYFNGKLEVAATRGDGWVGELVTENVIQIQAVPKEIDFKGRLEVRGEVFFTKKDFEELNQDIMNSKKIGRGNSTGPEAVFANPRNAASGTLRQLNSSIVRERKLSFVAYGARIYSN
jgi:DNA ligase (NAD+)